MAHLPIRVPSANYHRKHFYNTGWGRKYQRLFRPRLGYTSKDTVTQARRIDARVTKVSDDDIANWISVG